MRALVTGASGFVGSHLCEALVAAGDSVRAFLRRPLEAPWLAGVATVRGDLDDPASLAAAMTGVDVVYHVAGVTKALDEAAFRRTNERGVANVVEAAARFATPPVVVLVSSLAAAGPSPDARRPRDETVPPSPRSAYGRSKLAGEEVARRRAADLPLSIVRPPIVYGPRDKDVLELFRLARRGIVPQVGFSEKRFSAVHVADLARALRLAGRSGERVEGDTPGRGVYFVSDLSTWSWRDLAHAAGAGQGRRPWVLPLPASLSFAAGVVGEIVGRATGRPWIVNLDKAREGRAAHWTCDAGKAAAQLGFTPHFRVPEGFADTANVYRASGWL